MRFAVPLFFLLLIGCQRDPNAALLTIEEPSRQDVIGVYVVDRFYLPTELAGKSPNIMIELRADGSFSATNVPPWQLHLPGAGFFDSLISGTGHWEMTTWGLLDPGAHRIWGIYLRNGPPPAIKQRREGGLIVTERTSPVPTGEDAVKGLMSPAHFTGKKPPYGLIFQLGDPDSGYAILMKRKS